MASILRKLKLSSSSSEPPVPVETEENISGSYEYSFAVVYNGPPLTYSIPEVPTFKIDQIPVAAIASSVSRDLSVPIVQPLSKKKQKQFIDYVESSNSTSTLEALAVDDVKNETGFHSGRNIEMNMNVIPPNSDTTESGSSSGSYDVCSSREDECDGEIVQIRSPKHAKRPSAVTFRDPETNYMVDTDREEFVSRFENGNVPVRPQAVRLGKKGSCYKCLKGNRLTEKEACVVCNAKYCRSCVIRAMGSMPEGRKCLTCIGYKIDENKRGKLGKCSRMLKQLLSDSVVAQIMQAERSCEANQIPPDLVFVNSQALNREQLILLLDCPNPPKKLRPGSYWYDKASGFWGKEGQPPCQIISPQLDVGGRLQRNASNGNTNVIVNDREITKKELWILKLAGVDCEGTPNFWLNADGTYQEEGQRNDRGRIWDKRSAKLACAVLSLPVPSKSVTPSSEGEVGANKDYPQQKILHKFLLVGSVSSGACTIFKQAKLLYNVPFSENELQDIKLVIKSNLFTYLGILLEGRENFEEEYLLEQRKRCPVNESTSLGNTGDDTSRTIYSIGPRLKHFSDWLLECMRSGKLDAIFPAATRENGPFVEDLWKDEAIQATYNRRNELKMLPRSASYFLDRVR